MNGAKRPPSTWISRHAAQETPGESGVSAVASATDGGVASPVRALSYAVTTPCSRIRDCVRISSGVDGIAVVSAAVRRSSRGCVAVDTNVSECQGYFGRGRDHTVYKPRTPKRSVGVRGLSHPPLHSVADATAHLTSIDDVRRSTVASGIGSAYRAPRDFSGREKLVGRDFFQECEISGVGETLFLKKQIL